MAILIASIGVLIAAFVVKDYSPWLAGALAVFPIKALAVALMVHGRVAVHHALEGMIIWHTIWAVTIFTCWWVTR